ncbi:uncharacterized protein LOC122075141 isoform X2 [Macadamia integrifolia]|uniref:uncharacterized protein LOC122075141 isoform X2 n=1 Tax=Macadamia integrifolia TaxID=60698 RepID=UPI001C4F4462|nr:uncharacterized protein LOC122075141 isoform X2 [Macadamia integrifolia]
MAPGKGYVERMRRCIRTVFFMLTMVASLLYLSAPVLVALGDILVLCVLISSFTCVRCYGFKENLHRYGFRSSLVDIPLVSIIRSLVITCVYSFCDGPGLSHGPYLGTTTLCSFLSVLILSVKACIFTVTSKLEDEASSSPARQKLHLKKSWGMPVLFLSSLVFALGHIVAAYRTSCKARRKLLFHRVDPEAVLSCKVFSGFQKIPRSPTPSSGKTPKSDSETWRKPFYVARDERELPVRLLADIDSLFIACQGLRLHYKLSPSESSSQSIASTTFLQPNPSCSSPRMTSARLKFDRPPQTVPSKTQYHLHRSFSNQFHSSFLYDPLLDGSATSPVYLSEEIPVFSLDDGDCERGLSNPGISVGDVEGTGKFGIVLVHGFGGGVFSWRHVMEVLARQVGCTVAAFDRPGWGLTSRLRRKEWEEKQLPNPYKLDTQVDLLLAFCSEMGFSSVVLVGHDDGGLLVLKAAQKVQTSANSVHVEIKGVVLLSVSLSRQIVPAFARILLRTSLGKKHSIRPLLRTEIIQVVNRRAWYDATKLTTEVLSLYKMYSTA